MLRELSSKSNRRCGEKKQAIIKGILLFLTAAGFVSAMLPACGGR